MDIEEYLPYSKKKKRTSNLPFSSFQEKGGQIISRLNPKQIRYTHETINNKFSNSYRLADAINGLKSGSLKADDFPAIRVVFHRQLMWSLDNRRLYVFKEAGITDIPGR